MTLTEPLINNPLPAETLTALEGLSRQMQLIFPLQVANSWVYDYQGYSGDNKAVGR